MAGALVLTGATDAQALAASPIKPTYVLRQLADLLATDSHTAPVS
jgi:ribonucleotide monophosphatase NagD (HAD superfamily)